MKRILIVSQILVIVHYVVVGSAAYAVHYSNGINVMGFEGSYGSWMDLAGVLIDTFMITMWLIPISLTFWSFKMKEGNRKRKWIGVFATAAFILVGSWPMYFALISYWEHNWISPI